MLAIYVRGDANMEPLGRSLSVFMERVSDVFMYVAMTSTSGRPRTLRENGEASSIAISGRGRSSDSWRETEGRREMSRLAYLWKERIVRIQANFVRLQATWRVVLGLVGVVCGFQERFLPLASAMDRNW